MNLVAEITSNFEKWRYGVLDENITMYSRQFCDRIHHQLKGNFHSTFNCFVEGDKTTVVNCFDSYSSIVVFLPIAVERRNAIKPYQSEIARGGK